MLAVSARSGEGVDGLRGAIAARLGPAQAEDEAPLMRERQVLCVKESGAALARALAALRAAEPDELVASELRAAGRDLDRLLGRDVGAEVLETIFSRFCIGK